MAEDKANQLVPKAAEADATDTTDTEVAAPDPITSQSMSGLVLIFSLALLVSLAWALYDELYGQRPWKSIQENFVRQYTAYLKKLLPAQKLSEKEIRQSPEYLKIVADLDAANKAVAGRVRQIEAETSLIERHLSVITPEFQDKRAYVGSRVYLAENASSEKSKRSILAEIEKYKRGPFKIELPVAVGSDKVEKLQLSYDELEQRYNSLKDRKAALAAESAELLKPASELAQRRDKYIADHLTGLSQQQVEGLVRKMDTFTYEIKQINIPEANIVDRCESCHLGVREPVTLTRASFGKDPLAAAFVSHPDRELLQIHNPDRFGCSTCHGGNGRATTSVESAHGKNEHWLWPLSAKENVEAGCLQCHTRDRVLQGADVLGRGMDLFQVKGCYGCHRYEGFDRETEGLFNVRQTIKNLETTRANNLREAALAEQAAGQASDDQQAKRLYQRAQNLRLSNSGIDARIEQLDQQARFLMWDQKKIGPDLKEIRFKLRKEWIPVWLDDPQAFRPGTKMPRFRLETSEREAIAAFLWQSALKSPGPPRQPPGDAARGRELFETRGCLACHSIGDGSERIGGDFAANLSRVGEKANYDYIVRWVHNPRERTRPYCPTERRDIGPEDYAKKGLPFVFDLDHTTCPSCGRQLQVQQMTVMPMLRLTEQDARDVATYLTSLRKNGSYAPAPFMDDPKLKARGFALVKQYGCAGCHEIAGLEEEQRIGTELTKEGSKPVDRLDFALITREAKETGTLNHKGFFERKLKDPAIFDRGKIKPPEERLRMPNIALEKNDITALSTFLLGSVDAGIPSSLFYDPPDQRRDIQEGWWVIKKYNCMGCHNIQIGQKTALETLPRYQDPDWKDQLPPKLYSEGARVDPNWLLRFLSNPALSEKDADRNGVRTYLKARMPTFSFSPNELRTLVRFFAAISSQAEPYIAQKLDAPSEEEKTLARALFTSQAAPCLKCHLTGDSATDKTKTAPNFLQARERLKPAWTERWLLDPALISPGTAMPSGLFRREGTRRVFSGPTPEAFKRYDKDHIDLLVRYIFALTPEEQRRLGSVRGGTPARAGRRDDGTRRASTGILSAARR